MKKCAENFNRFCIDYPEKCRFCGAFREPTNADRLRAMSDEELAKLLCCTGWRMFEYKECLEWLKQPAEEDDHETS